ncbi:MAG: hypothetical protein ACTSUF_08015 [Candidatus Heimdallarchaeaceae archaeon]
MIDIDDLTVMSYVHEAGYKIIPTPVGQGKNPKNRMTLIRPNGKESHKDRIYNFSESAEMWEDIKKEYHKIKKHLDGIVR